MLDEYIAVDLEMTGLKPSRDKILEIGAVYMKDGVEVDEFETLVVPEITIPEEIVKLTHITQEMADKGKDKRVAILELLEFQHGLPLLAHNVLYDYSFLQYNALQENLSFGNKVMDTLKIARKVLPREEKKNLQTLCQKFSIPRKQEHRALEDARAAAKLFEILKQEYGSCEPALFKPYFMAYKVKKHSPATERQKKYLKELADYHKIDLAVTLEGLTRSEASRITDQILSRYGKMT